MRSKDKAGQNPLENLRNDKQAQELLAHILSPLELEALKNNYRSFSYQLGDITVQIGSQHCKAMFDMSHAKLRQFGDLLTRANRSLLGNAGEHREFLSQAVDDQELPYYLKNRLRSRGCYSLYDVMDLGPDGVLRIPGIGRNGIEAIRQLFAKNNCSKLFS